MSKIDTDKVRVLSRNDRIKELLKANGVQCSLAPTLYACQELSYHLRTEILKIIEEEEECQNLIF